MTYVIDASVAVKWFVEEDLRDEAEQILGLQDTLAAPDLIIPEVTNIAWKKATRGQIDLSHAGIIATAICNSPIILHPSSQINERALEIALDLNHPAYDCLYVACAEFLIAPLVTADQRFFNATRGGNFEAMVRYLGDPDLFADENDRLHPLKIPLSKIEDLARQAELALQTLNHVHKQLSGGKKFAFVNVRNLGPAFDSPAYRTLKAEIEGLPEDQLADVLALGWLGQGHSGTDWQVARERAETMVGSLGGQYHTYICSLTCYLRQGLAILQRHP